MDQHPKNLEVSKDGICMRKVLDLIKIVEDLQTLGDQQKKPLSAESKKIKIETVRWQIRALLIEKKETLAWQKLSELDRDEKYWLLVQRFSTWERILFTLKKIQDELSDRSVLRDD